MKLKIFTIFSVASFTLGTFTDAQASSLKKIRNDLKLQQISDGCGAVAGQQKADLFACFDADTYIVNTQNIEDLKAQLDDRFNYQLTEVLPKNINLELSFLDSIITQAEHLVDESDDLYSEAYGVSEALEDYLINASTKKGVRFFEDANAYWAPSVNARALVIVYPNRKIEVLVHGDTDG